MHSPTPPTYWPTHDWQEAPPQDFNINPSQLNTINTYIEDHIPGMHGLLIIKNGYLLFEKYYQGYDQYSYHNIASITKSIVSALIGIALTEGKITSIDQPMLNFFPELAAHETDSRKQAVTIRHLLNLTGGFSPAFPHQYWLNPVELAVTRPMSHEPGTHFHYDSQGVDILAGILTRVTELSAAAYASQTLFKELGIWQSADARFAWTKSPSKLHTWHNDALWDEQHGYPWKVDPQGYNTGGFGAHLTAREMAKLGYLYLHDGQWDGKQILPADFVSASTSEQSTGGPPEYKKYGFLWWLTQHNEHNTFLASGYAGRKIYVIPALDLIIVTVASTEGIKNNPDQANMITHVINQCVLSAS